MENPKKIRLIYSNDTYGYLEPCGCGGVNEGGLARRATLIARFVKAPRGGPNFDYDKYINLLRHKRR